MAPKVPRTSVLERIDKVLEDNDPSIADMTAFREAYPIDRKGSKPLSWRTCPSCMSKATKIFNLNTGLLECQLCGHHYLNPNYVPNDPQ